MSIRVAHATQLTLPTAIVLSVVVLCGWIPDFLWDGWAVVLPTFLLTILNAFVFFGLCIRTDISRHKDGLPIFVYLLTVTAFPSMHSYWQGQVVMLLIWWSVYALYACLREIHPEEWVFGVSILLVISSFLIPDMVWMVILPWVVYIGMRIFSLRVVSASLLGISLTALYMLAAVCMGWYDWPYGFLLERGWIGMALPIEEVVPVLFLIGIGIGLLSTIGLRMQQDNIGRQWLFIVMALFFVGSAIVSLFPIIVSIGGIDGGSWKIEKSMFPMVAGIGTGLMVLCSRQRESAARGWLFIFYVVGMVGIYMVSLVRYLV